MPKTGGHSGLFDGLNETSLQMVLGNSVLQTYESGCTIFQQGDMPTHVYVVIEGTLRTLRNGEDGDEATIRMLRPGETCMEAVIFMGGPSPISVQAIEDSKVLLVPASFIKSHALRDGQFATNLLQIVTHHYKNAMHQIDAMQIKSPLQRIGYFFLEKFLEAGKPDGLTLPFKKTIIANYLGMTPETFSRALNKIRDIGVDIDGEKIHLSDAFVLCQFCDADMAHLCPRHETAECPVCPLHTNRHKA
ncbi:MAG: Crp/Fnr family transcriptional regulator [Rhodospirillales bacterium]|nr:Crp/Fnr family transcriptional regulator [Rhodospirillales bacterium]USO08586.1 MAG: Crp/Fnr family transcriptional regulator [Rhodospirillales bacterium]